MCKIKALKEKLLFVKKKKIDPYLSNNFRIHSAWTKSTSTRPAPFSTHSNLLLQVLTRPSLPGPLFSSPLISYLCKYKTSTLSLFWEVGLCEQPLLLIPSTYYLFHCTLKFSSLLLSLRRIKRRVCVDFLVKQLRQRK